MRQSLLALFVAVAAVALARAEAGEAVSRPASNTDPEGKVGERPYEMAWANRTPAYPELVDFEDLEGWTAVGFRGCTADLYRSREEQMFGTHTGKVVYKGGTAASSFELRPPKPIPIPGEPTAAQMWVRGNNWGWHPKPRTARTHIQIAVRDAKGENFAIALGTVNFDYWFLMHATFVSPTGRLTRLTAAPGTGDGKLDYPLSFVALRVTNCSDDRPARLSVDSLQFYEVAYPPLPELRPPPTDVPWPTTPETITPTPTEPVRTSVRREGAAYVLAATGKRDTIRWLYTPRMGTLDDLIVEINGRRFQTNAGGGPLFELDGAERNLTDYGVSVELLGQELKDGVVETRWRASRGDDRAEFTWRLRAKDKSLQITVASPGEAATAFRIGRTRETPSADLIRVPYLTLGAVGPHIVHTEGVFVSGLLDWYHSDASTLDAEHGRPEPDQVVYNGGSRYLPKTDGRRNPLRERLVVTVATDFHEVLPNIPHPQNSTAHLAKGAIWRNIGAPNRDLLKRLKALGVERFICPLHEIGWRDGGESFTFRLRCAPRIGDEAMGEYGEWVKSLGYWFGLYANYTDYAPVNGLWREGRVCLQPDGNWTGAWPRCYAPKPTFAWLAEAELAPQIAAKFGANTCYSDVHTAVAPWGRTDYDARAPGAGMFRTSWACYAQVLWNECKAYGGPVFSEGRMHWMYAGLISGNYAQITGPDRWRVPPLVDFDLLKMHPLMTDFGMGMPSMFYPRHGGEWRTDRSRTSPWLDRFITSTLAFGHIGFLPMEWGVEGAVKAFYMTNAVQQLYALVPVEAIRYFDGERLLTTSEAIRTGAYRRGQVYVRYESGLELWCNLSFDHDWRVECDGQSYLLPPTGHLAFKQGALLQYTALVDGRRIDYVRAPDYTFLDTRDAFAAVGPLACRGAAALKPAGIEANWWLVPVAPCQDLSLRPAPLGFAAREALEARAHDLDDQPLGEAEVRVSNLGHTIFPVKGAVRYRVRPKGRLPVALVVDDAVRRLVGGLDYAVGTAVANTGRGPLRRATVTAELVGPDGQPTPAGGPLALGRVREGREAMVPFAIRVPASAERGERLWYRVRVEGTINDQPADGTAWFTGLAARAIDVELRPAKPEPQRPGSRQQLALVLRSNLPGTTAVTIEAVAPALGISPAELSIDLSEGVERELSLDYVVPREPAVAPIELAFQFPQGTMTEHRWLRVIKARPVAVDLAKLTPGRLGMAYRGKAEESLRADSGGSFYASRRAVGGVEKAGFFCHPPYKGGVGSAFGEFEVTLPDEPCAFETFLGFSDGSTTEDGCVFSLDVRVGEERETVWRTQYARLKRWTAFRADLSKFRGKKVSLRLTTDVGPRDNSSSDWAVWGEPRIVLMGERLLPEVFAEEPTLPVGPPLLPLKGLKASDLKTTAEAKIVLDGAGVNGGEYQSDIYLNEVLVGHTPESRADTSWTEKQALPVPREALETIGPRNVVVLRNPGLDYLKVRRIHLWFRLRDGREGTSVVVNGPFTTPPGWEHAEGVLVPHGEDIAAECDIPVVDSK